MTDLPGPRALDQLNLQLLLAAQQWRSDRDDLNQVRSDLLDIRIASRELLESLSRSLPDAKRWASFERVEKLLLE